MRIIVKYLAYFSFNIHSINMTNPIQLTYSEKFPPPDTDADTPRWRANVDMSETTRCLSQSVSVNWIFLVSYTHKAEVWIMNSARGNIHGETDGNFLLLWWLSFPVFILLTWSTSFLFEIHVTSLEIFYVFSKHTQREPHSMNDMNSAVCSEQPLTVLNISRHGSANCILCT